MEKPVSQVAAASKPITTFVHVDTNTFREVVQRLTGPSELICEATATATAPAHDQAPAAGMKVVGMKRSTSKLHERRQYTRPKLEIVKPAPAAAFHYYKPTTTTTTTTSQTGTPGFLPSPVTTPSSTFSKLSILERENNGESAVLPHLNSQEEERAIKERRFYLHPSPRGSRPGHTEPELLTLFPLTSPKTSDI